MDILNRRTGLLLSSLLLGIFLVQPTQAQPGILAGANYNSLSDVQTEQADGNFDNATGFHVGLFYDMAFGPLALRPTVLYMEAGELQFETEDGQNGPEVRNFNPSLLAFPIDARFQLAALPLLKPYLLAGPVFRLALNDGGGDEANGNGDDGFTTNDFTVAGDVGIGVEIDLPGPGLRLFPELRYSFGLQQYVDQLPGDFQAEEGGRLNAYMLRLGIGF